MRKEKMEQEQLLHTCKDELNLVLSFFSRVDAKGSVVLAVDTGMLGYLAAHLPSLNALHWWELLFPALSIALLAVSIWHLYKGAFPQLKGGAESFVYFAEIAKRTEAEFIGGFMGLQELEYIKDVLGQVHRNSVILTEKFAHLKWAFTLLAGAVLPWTISLADFALRTPVSQVITSGK
jgi:hypothetical protein